MAGLRMGVVSAVFGCASVFGQTVWTSATDGLWTNGAAWSAGVPNANTAYLTNSAASYTVTVDATPGTPFGNLTVNTAAGNTTRLLINAPGFACTNGVMTFGRGAEATVGSGASLLFQGRPPATPFLEVKDGGVWRLDGGTADFSAMRRTTPTSGNSQIYIGNNTTGQLQITAGKMLFTGFESAPELETNNTVQLRIGTGTRGRGELVMTGGELILYCNNTQQSTLSVGEGTSAAGYVLVTNDAVLVVSNFVSLGRANSTGTLTIAGNARVRHLRGSTRFQVGIENYAQGTVNVRENGNLELIGQDGINFGGQQNYGRGVLNVEGGRVDAGAGITLCRATGSKGGTGELNLSGGEINIGKSLGYGLLVGRGDGAIGAAAQAKLNISGGLLDISRAMWNATDHLNGIVLGWIGTSGNTAQCEARISGGTVTNSGQFAVGAGFGSTGVVYQTGGVIQQGVGRAGVPCNPMTIGWGGGIGSYTLSDGIFESAKPVFVGGITTADLGYTPNSSYLFYGNALGTLRIDGGTFTVTNQTLFVGRNGAGTLIIGTNGVCSAKDLVLTNNTRSTLRFELGPAGPGKLTALGTLTIAAGSKLEVDATAYRGSGGWIKLVDCAARTTAFAPENITLTGPGSVRQNRDEDLWLFIQRGTIISVL